jgi:putative nucleotidyltransferase with HDIG domain
MTASQIVAKTKHLPPVSQAALRLVGLLGQAEVSNEDIVHVLKYDNVLTAKLLRACNSPIYGLQEPVASVDQAVLLLGHNQLLQIVLNLAFGSAMAVPLPGYAVAASELWRHSLITAAAAETALNQGLPVEADPAVAFTAGLLHDIGKLILNEALTVEAQFAIRKRVSEAQQSRVVAEKEVTGTDHAEVGACLLQQWRLPETILEAVAHHHQPALEPKPRLSAVIHLANCLAHLAGSSPGWEAYAIRADESVAAALQLSGPALEMLVLSTRDSFARMEHFMNPA